MYQQLAKDLPFDFGYHERGLLMLYKSKEAEHEEVRWQSLRTNRESKLMFFHPMKFRRSADVRVDVRGGIFFPGDPHLTPGKLVPLLINHLKEQGVKFQPNTTVSDFVIEQEKIKTIKTNTGD